MPWRDPRHVDLGTAGGAGTDGDRRTARQAGLDRLRQRHRIHLQCHAELVQGHSHRLALHRAGQADPERLRRELSTAGCDEFLDETLFFDLHDAQTKIAAWVADYNGQRPHSSLQYLTPAAYAATFTATGARLRNPDQLRRSPVAPPAPLGVQTPEALTPAG